MSIFNIFMLFVALVSQVVSQDLTSASVAEGKCNPLEAITYGALNVDPLFFLTAHPFYISMGSESMYRGYFEVLKGRPATSETELATLKPILNLEATGTVIFNTTGFSQPDTYYIRQGCPTSGPNQFACVPLVDIASSVYLLGTQINITVPLSAPGTDTSGITTSVDTVVLTDNTTFGLITRCLNNTVRDWKLLTINSTVSADLRQTIVDKVTQIGFNSTNIREMTF